MKTKKFNRAQFADYISGYTVINLLNCICVIIDKILPRNETLMVDFIAVSKIFNSLLRSKLKHTTHFPDDKPVDVSTENSE
jgi:hypothetical protein